MPRKYQFPPQLSPRRVREYILEAIVQGVEAALQHRSQFLPTHPGLGTQPSRQVQMEEDQISLQECHSPWPSVRSDESILEEGELDDQELSEDEDLAPGRPALFSPSLFKSLLYKARATANLEVAVVPQTHPKNRRTQVNVCSLNL